jgi:hypothetical protein
MGQAGKFVVVGVPWSGSQIYKLSKQFSKASSTWENVVERDFYTLREYFEQASLHLLNESVIGGRESSLANHPGTILALGYLL